jgi:hypothetical protein
MALKKALNIDLSSLAQIIQSKGRGRDTVLAHITPQEAALLKRRGGRGSTNPYTGLLEFDDASDIGLSQTQLDAPLPQGNEALPEAGLTATPYAEGLATGGGAAPIVDFRGQPIENEADRGTVTPEQAAYSQQYSVPYSSAETTAGNLQAGLTAGGQIPTGGLNFITPQGPVSPSEVEMPQTPTTSTETPSLLSQAAKALGVKEDTLGRGALATGLGLYGALQGKQAQTQNEAATAQKQAIAQPYQQQGQELVRAAQAGELTPANQQLIQQQRARLAQASANMGGVGQQQIENQISSLTAQLLQNQYQYGLQVMQIGDNIALGAINTQLQLDQQLNQANKSFYTSLAQIAAGSPMYVPGLSSVTPTRTP